MRYTRTRPTTMTTKILKRLSSQRLYWESLARQVVHTKMQKKMTTMKRSLRATLGPAMVEVLDNSNPQRKHRPLSLTRITKLRRKAKRPCLLVLISSRKTSLLSRRTLTKRLREVAPTIFLSLTFHSTLMARSRKI